MGLRPLPLIAKAMAGTQSKTRMTAPAAAASGSDLSVQGDNQANVQKRVRNKSTSADCQAILKPGPGFP